MGAEGHRDARSPRTRRATFEANSDEGFAFGDADVWRILVTWDGVPCTYVQLADPGATGSPALTDAALRRAAEYARRRERAVETLARRLGVREPDLPRPTCTVVMCTHRRPQLAARALAALTALDPPADEIVVVDNAPGDEDCRQIAADAGARYVLEARRGQDWARAAGLAAATSEVVAYVDDDVTVSPGWLRPLARLFADPAVGAATGVAVGRTLTTPAQNLRESFASFVPGLRPRQFDWTTVRPVGSGAAGAGANMIFRRSLLLELGEVFPPELDVGTRTRSGGDLYALYRVLAAGRRVAFDPELYAEHEHPADAEALRETILSYGTGFSAFLTKALVEHRELSALMLWWWLVGRLVNALAWDRLVPHEGHVGLRLDYIRGGLGGSAAWVSSRRAQRGRSRPLPRPPARDQELVVPAGVAVIRDGTAAARNRAARGSRAAVLLFLGTDAEPAADLAERHLARHEESQDPRVVVGYTAPHAATAGLAAQLHALQRFDYFRAAREAAVLTIADATGENLSIGRDLFERLGGFDDSLAVDAAARELGLRALQAGATIQYEPAAVASCTLDFGTREALEGLARAGADDARIATRHPAILGALPLGAGPGGPPANRLLGRVAAIAACRWPRAAGLVIAELLERARLRGAWLGVYTVLGGAAYRSGYLAGKGPRRPGARGEIDLAATDAIAQSEPAVGVVALRSGSRWLGCLRPRGGQWGRRFAEKAVELMDEEARRALQRAHYPWAPEEGADGLAGTLVVFGPEHEPGDDRHAGELVAGGARVERLAGHTREHWEIVCECVASAPEPVIALPLPGVRAGADWLRAARIPLEGDRVAVVMGAGVTPGTRPLPTSLISRAVFRGVYRPVGGPPQFALLSTRHVAALGGLDPATARFGPHGPVLDVMERALDAGFVVAYQETPGIDPAATERPERPRQVWRRARARGGLLARHAREQGLVRGSSFLAGQLIARPLLLLGPALRWGEPGLRHLLGTTLGELVGCAHALTAPSDAGPTLRACSRPRQTTEAPTLQGSSSTPP